MYDKEYYEKIKKVNKDNLYREINKNKSDKWKDFEVTGKLNKKDVIHDTVTALAESEATGEIAKIFSDIRSTMKIPMLTSIWRILADSFEDLDSAWRSVKPIYKTDQPEAALNRLRSEASFPKLMPISFSSSRLSQILEKSFMLFLSLVFNRCSKSALINFLLLFLKQLENLL